MGKFSEARELQNCFQKRYVTYCVTLSVTFVNLQVHEEEFAKLVDNLHRQMVSTAGSRSQMVTKHVCCRLYMDIFERRGQESATE